MFVLHFKWNWLSCVVRGQTWKNDDRFKGIQEAVCGMCDACDVLATYVVWCCCKLWEGRENTLIFGSSEANTTLGESVAC